MSDLMGKQGLPTYNSIDEAMEVIRKMKEANKGLPPERAYTGEMVRMPYKDKYDVMAEDEQLWPISERRPLGPRGGRQPRSTFAKQGRAHLMGAEQSIDALGQFGANYIYPWLNKIIPDDWEIDREAVNRQVAERQKMRDARMRRSGWPEKISHFVGSLGFDPTTYVPGMPKGSRFLQRGAANTAEAIMSDQFTNPATDPDNYYGQKMASGALAGALGPVAGEAGHQAMTKGIPRILKYGEDLEGIWNRGIFNKRNEFFGQDNMPNVELYDAMKKQGWDWHTNMSPDDQKSMREMAELFTRKPMGTTADELVRIASYRKIEVDPMLQNVKRDYRTWASFQRLRNDELGGGPVREAFDKQNKQITDFGEKLELAMGGTQKSREAIGDLTHDLMQDLDTGELSRISQMYKQVGEYYDEAGLAPNAKPVLEFLDNIGKTQVLTREGREVIAGVKRLMKEQGFLEDIQIKGKSDFKIIPSKMVAGKRTPGMNPNQWEALRKSLNEAYSESMSKTQKGLYRKIKKKIDEHILDQAGDEFSVPRKQYQAFMEAKDNKMVQKILDGDLDPKKMIQTLMSGPTKDLISVKKYLIEFGGEVGEKMWNEIRGGVWARSFRRGLQGYSAKNEAGEMIFSGAAFAKRFDNPDDGMTREMREVLFTELENKRIDALLEVIGELQIPVHGTVNFSNTAYAMINFIQGAGGIQGVHSPMFWIRKAFQATGSEVQTMKNINEGRRMADVRKGFPVEKRADYYRAQQEKWGDINRRMSPMPAVSGDVAGETIAGGIEAGSQGYDWAAEQIKNDIERRREKYRLGRQ